MAGESFYKRFTSGSSPDFVGMAQANALATKGIIDSIGRIKDIFTDQQQKYAEENTANMSAYLKNQLRQQGLGADPIDTSAIKAKFGKLINMDQLISDVGTEKKQMEDDAFNIATKAGNDVLNSSQDPLAARKAFESSLRNMNAKEKFIANAGQTFNDLNATRYADIEANKIREKQTRSNALATALTETGVTGAAQEIERIISKLPEYEKNEERIRLENDLAEMRKLTSDQLRRHKAILDDERLVRDHKVQLAQNDADLIASQYDTIKDPISNASKKLVDNIISSGIGNNVQTVIREKMGLWGKGDATAFDDKINKLKKQYGFTQEEADQILAQSFSAHYDGDKNWFIDAMSDKAFNRAIADMDSIAADHANKVNLSQQLTKARQRVADIQFQEDRRINQLDQDLFTAAENKRVRFKDALGIDGKYAAIKANAQSNIIPQIDNDSKTNKKTDKKDAPKSSPSQDPALLLKQAKDLIASKGSGKYAGADAEAVPSKQPPKKAFIDKMAPKPAIGMETTDPVLKESSTPKVVNIGQILKDRKNARIVSGPKVAKTWLKDITNLSKEKQVDKLLTDFRADLLPPNVVEILLKELGLDMSVLGENQ